MHGCNLPAYRPMTHDYHTDAMQTTVTVLLYKK